jgi:hypothetical protein
MLRAPRISAVKVNGKDQNAVVGAWEAAKDAVHKPAAAANGSL